MKKGNLIILIAEKIKIISQKIDQHAPILRNKKFLYFIFALELLAIASFFSSYVFKADTQGAPSTYTIKGTVLSEADKSPLVNVAVNYTNPSLADDPSILEGVIGTTTDSSGNFTLMVPAQDMREGFLNITKEGFYDLSGSFSFSALASGSFIPVNISMKHGFGREAFMITEIKPGFNTASIPFEPSVPHPQGSFENVYSISGTGAPVPQNFFTSKIDLYLPNESGDLAKFIPTYPPTQHNIISAGKDHSLVIAGDGTIVSWGGNLQGQLGNGTNVGQDRTYPSGFSLPDTTALYAGSEASYALKKDGTVYAWGANTYGQLGIGSTERKNTPTQVAGLDNVQAMAVTNVHVLALKHDGTVWAWGYNYEGQIGDGTVATKNDAVISPKQVPGLSKIRAIAAGSRSSYAVTQTGEVYAWGRNNYGELGLGNTSSNVPTPTLVPNLTGVASVAAGGMHALARMNDGSVYAWGNNWEGQLGDGTGTSTPKPIKITSLSGISQVSAGYMDSFAVKSDRTVMAWGGNPWGELGLNDRTKRTSPELIPGMTDVISVSVGENHTVMLKANGEVYACGRNTYWDGHKDIYGRLGLPIGEQAQASTLYFVPDIEKASLPPTRVPATSPPAPSILQGKAFYFQNNDTKSYFLAVRGNPVLTPDYTIDLNAAGKQTHFGNPLEEEKTSGEIQIIDTADNSKSYNLSDAIAANLIDKNLGSQAGPDKSNVSNKDMASSQDINLGVGYILTAKKDGLKARFAKKNIDMVEIPPDISYDDTMWALTVDEDTFDEAAYDRYQHILFNLINSTYGQIMTGNGSGEPNIRFTKNGKYIDPQQAVKLSDKNNSPLTNLFSSPKVEAATTPKPWTSNDTCTDTFPVEWKNKQQTITYCASNITTKGEPYPYYWYMSGSDLVVMPTTPWVVDPAKKVDEKQEVVNFINGSSGAYASIKKIFGPPVFTDEQLTKKKRKIRIFKAPHQIAEKMKYVGITIGDVDIISLDESFFSSGWSSNASDSKNTLVHEMVHTFSNAEYNKDYNIYHSWDEGVAVLVTSLASTDLGYFDSNFNKHFGKMMINFSNYAKPFFATNNDEIWRGNYRDENWVGNSLSTYDRIFRYGQAGMAMTQLYVKDNNFLKTFYKNMMNGSNYWSAMLQTIGAGFDFNGWYQNQAGGLTQKTATAYGGKFEPWYLMESRASGLCPDYSTTLEHTLVEIKDSTGKLAFPGEKAYDADKLISFTGAVQDSGKTPPEWKWSEDCQVPPDYKNNVFKNKTPLQKVVQTSFPGQKYSFAGQYYRTHGSTEEEVPFNYLWGVPYDDSGIWGVIGPSGVNKVTVERIKPTYAKKEFDVTYGYYSISKDTDPGFGWNEGEYKITFSSCKEPYVVRKLEGPLFLPYLTGKDRGSPFFSEANSKNKLANVFSIEHVSAADDTCSDSGTNIDIFDVNIDKSILGQVAVKFTTSRPTRSFIEWGETTDYGQISDFSTTTDNDRIHHSITLSNLTDGKKYFYKIKAIDDTGGIVNDGINSTVLQNESGIPLTATKVGDFTAPTPPLTYNFSFEDRVENKVMVHWTSNYEASGELTFTIKDPSSGNVLKTETLTVPASKDIKVPYVLPIGDVLAFTKYGGNVYNEINVSVSSYAHYGDQTAHNGDTGLIAYSPNCVNISGGFAANTPGGAANQINGQISLTDGTSSTSNCPVNHKFDLSSAEVGYMIYDNIGGEIVPVTPEKEATLNLSNNAGTFAITEAPRGMWGALGILYVKSVTTSVTGQKFTLRHNNYGQTIDNSATSSITPEPKISSLTMESQDPDKFNLTTAENVYIARSAYVNNSPYVNTYFYRMDCVQSYFGGYGWTCTPTSYNSYLYSLDPGAEGSASTHFVFNQRSVGNPQQASTEPCVLINSKRYIRRYGGPSIPENGNLYDPRYTSEMCPEPPPVPNM